MAKLTLKHLYTNKWPADLLPKIVIMLFLGFSAGLPLLLIFSSLSIWLIEAGVARSEVTYFALAALAFSFKFIWAPLIDKLPIPILVSTVGRRRSWLILAQLAVAGSIISMAMIDPAVGLQSMAIAVVALGISAATQDIVIDAYRIEIATADTQAILSAFYIVGYRIGMVVSGAGSLLIAARLGTEAEYYYIAWQQTYFIMAGFSLVGLITTLLIKEPQALQAAQQYRFDLIDYIRFILLFIILLVAFIFCYIYLKEFGLHSGFIYEAIRLIVSLIFAFTIAYSLVLLNIIKREMLFSTYVEPFLDFYQRYKNVFIFVILLIALYRVSDIVLGTIANIFYSELGFSKEEIAWTSKTFGLIMTLLGGLAGGLLSIQFGVKRILLTGAVLSSITNLLFILLASQGHNIVTLAFVIAADNLSSGLAMAAFVAYLSSLTSLSFTASQYAIFSSLMTLFPKTLSAYSGTIVDWIGYDWFFVFTSLIGIPIILLILYLIYSDGTSAPTTENKPE